MSLSKYLTFNSTIHIFLKNELFPIKHNFDVEQNYNNKDK